MDFLTIKEFIKDAVKFILVVFCFVFLMVYVVSVTQVVGDSMSPTLENQEVLILNKAKYRFSDVKRGDIIAFTYEDTKYLIKRVIGMPGEYVSIKDNKVYINGYYYVEDYLKDVDTPDFELTDLGFAKIPDDMYFVLGDNRDNSLDSRKIGLVKKSDIIGEVAMRFWPITKIGVF